MDDRNLMENLLQLEKGACDLFLHGTMESSTFSVHQAFGQALTDSLGMQSNLYDKMAAKGWYQSEEVQQNKINEIKQQYRSQAQ